MRQATDSLLILGIALPVNKKAGKFNQCDDPDSFDYNHNNCSELTSFLNGRDKAQEAWTSYIERKFETKMDLDSHVLE